MVKKESSIKKNAPPSAFKENNGYGGGLPVKTANKKVSDAVAEYLKANTGIPKSAISDTTRTPIQFIDTPVFDPLTFFVQKKSRRELNFRFRYYYNWHPLVRNVVDLHSTFPLSDFAVLCKGKNKTIEKDYESIKEDLDLLTLGVYIFKDFYIVGESIVYGRWDDTEKSFTEFIQFPPENVIFKAVYILNKPLMFLEVDSELRRIVNSGQEADKILAGKMDPNLVGKIKDGKTILLDEKYTTHFPNKSSGYDIRGTSLIQGILKDLMYEDKLRLLQSTFADRHMFPLKIFKLGNPQTGFIPSRRYFEEFRELLITASNDPDFSIIWSHAIDVDYVGTKDKIANLIPEFEFVESRILTGLFANKALTHGEGICATYDTETLTKRGFKFYHEITDEDEIATYNPETSQLEYHKPKDRICYEQDADIIYFENNWLDHAVTPNHRCYVQDKEKWKICRADEVQPGFRMKNTVDWVGIDPPKDITIEVEYSGSGPKPKVFKVPIEKYLQLLGYFLSEGSLEFCSVYDTKNPDILPNKRVCSTSFSQKLGTKVFFKMQKLFDSLPFNTKFKEVLYPQSDIRKSENKFYASWKILSRSLSKHLFDNCGHGSYKKRIPIWVKNLPKKYLTILLEALVDGDGIRIDNNVRSAALVDYLTVSKQLADDVQEVMFKLNQVSKVVEKERPGHLPIYIVHSTGSNHIRDGYSINPRLKTEHIKREKYKGLVYCFEVPNRLFVMRRKGKIVITHNTYANANVSVRVLMHRYMLMRDMLSAFFRNKVFKPIAEARGYKQSDSTNIDRNPIYSNGKYYSLILPQIKWRKLNLLDDTQQKQFLMQLHEKQKIPMKLISEIFDLDYDMLRSELAREQGTVVDQVYVAARDTVGNENPEAVLKGANGVALSKLSLEKKKKQKEEEEKGLAEEEFLEEEMPPPPEEREVEEVTPTPEEEAGF